MPIWVDTKTKDIIIDWHGTEVIGGKALFSEEADTWMFEEANGLENLHAPESRYTLSDEMDSGLQEELDVAVSENQGEWFRGVSPTELLFGAESAQDGVNE